MLQPVCPQRPAVSCWVETQRVAWCSLRRVRVWVDEEGLAEDLSGQLAPRPGEERVIERLVCEHRGEVSAGGVSSDEEALGKVCFEEQGVLDDLEMRGSGREAMCAAGWCGLTHLSAARQSLTGIGKGCSGASLHRWCKWVPDEAPNRWRTDIQRSR